MQDELVNGEIAGDPHPQGDGDGVARQGGDHEDLPRRQVVVMLLEGPPLVRAHPPAEESDEEDGSPRHQDGRLVEEQGQAEAPQKQDAGRREQGGVEHRQEDPAAIDPTAGLVDSFIVEHSAYTSQKRSSRVTPSSRQMRMQRAMVGL